MPAVAQQSAPALVRSAAPSGAARHAVPGIVIEVGCEVGSRPRKGAGDEPQAYFRAVGVVARRLRDAAAADADLGSSSTGSRSGGAQSAAEPLRSTNRSRAVGCRPRSLFGPAGRR